MKRLDKEERVKYEEWVEEDFKRRENSYKRLRLMHSERGGGGGDLKVGLGLGDLKV